MTRHSVVIAGGGPTGLMLAGELALAGVDVAIVERRVSQALAGSRAGGLHSRTIEVLDQRGIADRFVAQGQVHKVVHFHVPLDLCDFPSRHNYVLGLWAEPHRAHPGGVGRRARSPIHRGGEVAGFAQDDHGRRRRVVRRPHPEGGVISFGCDGGAQRRPQSGRHRLRRVVRPR
jgi:3-(3-hydroxy-phenyl)propionate hydroxylase